jgi:hypothetical protein
VDAAGKVVPYFREGSDELATKVRIAHQKLALSEYTNQKEALDKHHEKTEEDIFVANYKAVVNEGTVRSLSTWTRDCVAYLPRTDHVMLVVLNEEQTAAARLIEVPFAAVEDRLTLVPELHPPRYRAVEFPSDAELDELAKTAVG